MKDLNCINRDTANFVNDITESFKCGDCGEVNPGLLIDNNIENDYDMELCVQNEEIKILEEAVGFYADKENWSYVNQNSQISMKKDAESNANYTATFAGKRARQALEKLKEIRKKK